MNGSGPYQFVGEALNVGLQYWEAFNRSNIGKNMTSVIELGGSWALSFSWTQTRAIISYIKFYEHFG